VQFTASFFAMVACFKEINHNYALDRNSHIKLDTQFANKFQSYARNTYSVSIVQILFVGTTS